MYQFRMARLRLPSTVTRDAVTQAARGPEKCVFLVGLGTKNYKFRPFTLNQPHAYQSSPDMATHGGYECKFVKSPPEGLQTECCICLLVLRCPHITNCCGRNFCITRVQKDGKVCPLSSAMVGGLFLTYN